MSSSDRFSIPLLAQLVPGGIKPGTIFIVEFDPDSEWLAVAATIAAEYLQAGGRVGYATDIGPPEAVKERLGNLGVDVPLVINESRLIIDDWYTATLTGGRIDTAGGKTSFWEPIEGGSRARSLKLADLSVEWLTASKEGWEGVDVIDAWPPGSVIISDVASELLRFNEETAFVEFCLTRSFPYERKRGHIALLGQVRGVQNEAFYRRMELASDGVIDIIVQDQDGASRNLLRLRALKSQPHDNRWHEIDVKPNGEAAIKT